MSPNPESTSWNGAIILTRFSNSSSTMCSTGNRFHKLSLQLIHFLWKFALFLRSITQLTKIISTWSLYLIKIVYHNWCFIKSKFKLWCDFLEHVNKHHRGNGKHINSSNRRFIQIDKCETIFHEPWHLIHKSYIILI